MTAARESDFLPTHPLARQPGEIDQPGAAAGPAPNSAAGPQPAAGPGLPPWPDGLAEGLHLSLDLAAGAEGPDAPLRHGRRTSAASTAWLILRLFLGGAVCGAFAGLLVGGLVGSLCGLLLGNVSFGLDGALIAGPVLALVGGVYGATVAAADLRKHHGGNCPGF